MNTNMFALASGLSDQDLLARVGVLARTERETSAELVAHLAVLDARPSLFAAEGHGSLFSYCTKVLRLSEDATCTRIHVARACRRFPAILDRLATGALSLSAARMLAPCLTAENHEAVLARAAGRSRREIECLVAELAPRPDVPSSVRKLPAVTRSTDTAAAEAAAATVSPAEAAATTVPTAAAVVPATVGVTVGVIPSGIEQESRLTPPSPVRRPIIETTSPERYRVQFTIGKEGHDRLRRLQDLLRREIADGDPGVIVERALALLLEEVEKAKFAATTRPQRPRPIRPGTDRARARSRDIPNDIQRAAWQRDGGQCGFVGRNGQRCTERSFLEFHHIRPYALGGESTLENISLRCRRHNQYEADLVFGPRGHSMAHQMPLVAAGETCDRQPVSRSAG